MTRSQLKRCVVLLAACSDPSAPTCATQIADEVCATPAQLRGAEPVQATAAESAVVSLPPAPLAEGRYVLVTSRYSCPADAELPAPPPVQGVLELSGCVLRRTLVSPSAEEPRVDVFQLADAGGALLELQHRCPAEEARTAQASYGFDGTLLELERWREDAEGAAACDTLDTWELR